MELNDLKQESDNKSLLEDGAIWHEEHENILADWADKAMCFRWLHNRSNQKFNRLNTIFTIPVIVLSTLTGTANFAQDRVPVDYRSMFVMGVGSLNLIAGIISTIQQFLKISELNESHRVASIALDKFYRNIKIELAKSPRERIPVTQMMKITKEEFDRLMETCPQIPQKIVLLFKETFKTSQDFALIHKPEICDELVPTSQYKYVSKEEPPVNTNPFKLILNQQREHKTNKAKVNTFINEFQELHGRPPQEDEIIENVSDDHLDEKKVASIINDLNIENVNKKL